MVLHILLFGYPGKNTEVTDKDLELLRQAAEAQGHSIKLIYDYDCQIKFNGQTKPIIKNTPLKDIKSLFVKANFLGFNKLHFRQALIRQLEQEKFTVVNKSDAVMNAKNKLRTLQTLNDNNIPMPKTYVINHAEDLDGALADIGKFPVILKAPSGSHGKGVSLIESKRGLQSIIEMFSDFDHLVIQEYIKESKGKDVRVFIVGNKIVGAMERITTKRGEFRSNFHLGGKVLMADLTDNEKTIAMLAAKACGLDIAGVDILRTKQGPKVIEVNANPGLEGISQATGKDIAGEIIKYMAKRARK